MDEKVCSRCFKTKPVEEFKRKNEFSKDLTKKCLECRNRDAKYYKEYAATHNLGGYPSREPENVQKYRRTYYLNNKERLTQKSRDRYKEKKKLLEQNEQ